ncbi:MAG: hypothetical protein M0036_20695 [Desulfobacteraceae bacterium]|nr:hypothetical protein [Desulfobacteraceae bacterium]
MGIPRLNKKNELNYRRGTTSFHCSVCDHFRAEGWNMRCAVLGLFPGRSYQIGPNNRCDAFDNAQRLKQLGVE